MVDVIVVGGGHAGVEAALACARKNHSTILCSISIDMIASMPCNPSIGGPAKGIVVREIDALGGQMAKTTDATGLQFKMLNTNKGPGVQSLRAQSDKIAYQKKMQDICLSEPNLEVVEGIVEELIVEQKTVKGVRLKDGRELLAQAVILTTGTYMASLVMISDQVRESGPDNQPTTNRLSENLRELGLKTMRLKTGTPPRVLSSSVNFAETLLEPNSEQPYCFSYETTDLLPLDQQVHCYLTYTNEKTHKLIHDNLNKSSMYSGVVKGVGPRYCPSIEDKLVRFADKERHQLFLEPESLSMDTTYIQGFSTSLPIDVQTEMVHSLKGLENCVIKKYAYAIEYDAIDPLQMKPSLESKIISNLFCAGQINGTSGYEEAAGQGLIAGINTALKIEGRNPLILKRDEAYIGVLIDDLVTKGTKEPYRLLTSRAEYRLLLRHDNADQRLTSYGYNVGLISPQRYQKYLNKMEIINQTKELLKTLNFGSNSSINDYLIQKGYEKLTAGINGYNLIKRPNITLYECLPFFGLTLDQDLCQQIDIEIKYEGYIEKAKKDANRLREMENVLIPDYLDYNDCIHLSLEARSKLDQIKPLNLGQASRISGVNPADIAVLAVYIKQIRGEKAG